jgi:hypothetical protein
MWPAGTSWRSFWSAAVLCRFLLHAPRLSLDPSSKTNVQPPPKKRQRTAALQNLAELRYLLRGWLEKAGGSVLAAVAAPPKQEEEANHDEQDFPEVRAASAAYVWSAAFWTVQGVTSPFCATEMTCFCHWLVQTQAKRRLER